MVTCTHLSFTNREQNKQSESERGACSAIGKCCDSSNFRDEFREHGLSELVSIECRDVCQEGFGMKNIADAGTHAACTQGGPSRKLSSTH